MNDSKDHLIKTALDLFLKNNYHSVSLKDILNASGFSKGAFYHYFESKEECFEECVKHYVSMIIQDDWVDEKYMGSLKEYMHYSLEKYKHRKISSVYEAMIFLVDALRIKPAVLNYVKLQKQESLKNWIKVVENAIAAGEIKEKMPPRDIAYLFMHQAGAIAGEHMMNDNEEELIGSVKRHWDNIYNLLK